MVRVQYGHSVCAVRMLGCRPCWRRAATSDWIVTICSPKMLVQDGRLKFGCAAEASNCCRRSVACSWPAILRHTSGDIAPSNAADGSLPSTYTPLRTAAVIQTSSAFVKLRKGGVRRRSQLRLPWLGNPCSACRAPPGSLPASEEHPGASCCSQASIRPSALVGNGNGMEYTSTSPASGADHASFLI